MKSFLSIFSLIIASYAVSQTDTAIKYFNAALEPVTKSNATYNGKVYQAANGWNAIISDKSGVVMVKGSFRDKALQTKNGVFTYYHPDGKISATGLIDNNVQEGLWKTWYASGKLRDSVVFVRGIKDGYATSLFENGNPKFTGMYRGGDPVGDWTWYHENGKVATKEKYVKGKLDDLQCYDSTGNLTGIRCSIEIPPTIKGVYGGVNKFIMDSLAFPKEALDKQITGVVEIEFTITKQGTMENFVVVSTPSKILSDEVLRVLRSAPGWYPAVEHNRVIDYTVRLKVPFQRNEGNSSEED